LLTRIVIGRTSETDWLYNRLNYLSRVHESFRTREEFEQFKRSIHSNDASGYLKDKNCESRSQQSLEGSVLGQISTDDAKKAQLQKFG
jgi:hypothetical protein